MFLLPSCLSFPLTSWLHFQVSLYSWFVCKELLGACANAFLCEGLQEASFSDRFIGRLLRGVNVVSWYLVALSWDRIPAYSITSIGDLQAEGCMGSFSKIYFYLFERGGESFHPLVHFSDSCSTTAGAGSLGNQEAGTPSRSPAGGWQGPVYHHLLPPRVQISHQLNSKKS